MVSMLQRNKKKTKKNGHLMPIIFPADMLQKRKALTLHQSVKILTYDGIYSKYLFIAYVFM